MTKPSKTHCCACHLDDSAATVVHNALQLKEDGMAKTQAMLAASQQPDSCKRTRKDGMRSRNPQAWAERAVDAKEVLLLAQTKRREEALEAEQSAIHKQQQAAAAADAHVQGQLMSEATALKELNAALAASLRDAHAQVQMHVYTHA